jgi:predicted aldo/keto reductase-like oxidoreductase
MMIKPFHDKQLSLLGFGTMRLPLSGTERNAPIDEAAVNEMVRHAYEHGVNY